MVIPNPVSRDIFYEERMFNEESPVMLFIGSTPNKNLPRVIEALREVPCRLHVVGILSDADKIALREASIEYEVFFDLTGNEMAARYAGADIVLFPSTFEGFGMPVIEGQKAGRVVITSNISPVKEVSGDGACLVDPYSVNSIREGIKRVIRNKEYRENLIRSGFENVRKYEPGSIAMCYESLYDKILKMY